MYPAEILKKDKVNMKRMAPGHNYGFFSAPKEGKDPLVETFTERVPSFISVNQRDASMNLYGPTQPPTVTSQDPNGSSNDVVETLPERVPPVVPVTQKTPKFTYTPLTKNLFPRAPNVFTANRHLRSFNLAPPGQPAGLINSNQSSFDTNSVEIVPDPPVAQNTVKLDEGWKGWWNFLISLFKWW